MNSDSHPARMGNVAASVTTPGTPPIFQTAAFDIPDLDTLQQIVRGEVSGHIYTRDSNPNHSALADSIARLEGAEASAVFASGMAAISAVCLSLAGHGDHMIIARALYGRTRQLAERLQKQFDIRFTTVDVGDPEQFRKALTPRTKLAIVETISNPLLEVADISAIAAALDPVPLVVDATFTTPELSQPCRLGAAVTVHSASKYLNGHGDVMLGVASGARTLVRQMLETNSIFGLNANPFEAWLCQRGLRTLPLRMQQICATARRLAQFLAQQSGVRRVHYPLLPDHRSYEVAKRLYPHGTGGIVSLELAGSGRDAVNRFLGAIPGIPFLPTLAEPRTSVSWPAGTSHSFLSARERTDLGITDELVRLSVGLEPFEMLRDELEAGLAAQSR